MSSVKQQKGMLEARFRTWFSETYHLSTVSQYYKQLALSYNDHAMTNGMGALI